MDTTSKGMIEFLEKAGKTGQIKPNTAHSLSTAVKQMMKIDDNWEQVDISQLDVDGYLARFRNLHGLKYKQESLAEYERRFKRAIQLYLEYVRSPRTWKFDGHASSNRKTKPKQSSNSKSIQPLMSESVETATVSIAPSGIQMMDYPFPLREACVVRLRLPADLKVSEVERLAAFMRTVAIDFTATEA